MTDNPTLSAVVTILALGFVLIVFASVKKNEQTPEWSIHSDSLATCYKHRDASAIVCIPHGRP